ncbi:MAG: hypothetical protein GF308_13280 [Candidatus Heimdallarchaeota archaeon]|nr:hypothetical protein [Candidatus Heimdallarchaeota archaeon]
MGQQKSDDLDKWIAVLSKLAQCKDGSSDEQELGLSFYAIRSSAVSDYHKLKEILERMEEKGFIKMTEESRELSNGDEQIIRRYQITRKGIKTLVEVLIPAKDALRGLE